MIGARDQGKSADPLCLSVRQPWAWLIVNGYKDIENREWPTRVRGRVLIHAGGRMTRADYEACRIFIGGFTMIELPGRDAAALWRGGIVGEAEIVDCVTWHESPWFCGTHGFVLRGAQPLPFAPCSGALGFFRARP